MKVTRRTGAGALALAAALLLIAAGYQGFDRYRDVLLWKRAEATVVDSEVAFRHDGEGLLRYFVRASLRYATPSGEQTVRADSSLDSPDYAAPRSRLDKYKAGKRVTVYYDPARPEKARFGAELSRQYLGKAFHYFIGGLLAAVAALLVLTTKKAPRFCAGCRNAVKHHHRYCPFCGASLSSRSHRIPHERPVGT
jgi:hypothetical protein